MDQFHIRSRANVFGQRFVVVAFALAMGTVALPALPAGATGGTICRLGQPVVHKDCLFDMNGDGDWDWAVSDLDGDGIYDTSTLDTDFNGYMETFYTTIGSPDGSAYTRYDHDEDALKDDEELVYGTDPYTWDSDGDGWSDGHEVYTGSSPLDPWCNPYGCG